MNPSVIKRIENINNGIVPEGYKKTKVGIVPVEWDIENLKELCEISSGNTPSRNRNNNFVGDNKWLSSGELKSKYIYDSNEKISDEAASELKKYPAGTVVIAIYGLEADGVRGSCSILAVPCSISQACMAFEKFNKLHNEFFYYWYQFNGNTIGLRYAQGTKQQNLSSDIVEKLNVSVPPLPEQQKIAEILSTQDKLIELQEKKIEQLKELKKAYLQKMFPKKGSKYPELRFKGFTDPWEQRKLSEISEKVSKKNQDMVVDEVFTNSAEFGIISQRDYFDKDIANSENIDGYYIVEPNDFVYNPRISTLAPFGPVRRNKLDKSGAMSPLYYVFRTHNVDCGYLEYFFKTNRWHSFMHLNGNSGARSDRFAIRDEVFRDMPISMPQDIVEQKKVGDFFSTLELAISLHQRKSEQEKQKKKALMQLLLTGIVRTK